MPSKFTSAKSKLRVKSKYEEEVSVKKKERFTKEGRKMFRYFAAYREYITGKHIPLVHLEKAWGASVFNKIRNNITDYEKTTGIQVSLAEYVRAMFLQYGEETYPNRMLSDTSFDIYRKHRESLGYVICDNDDIDSYLSQLETLESLAAMRNEDPKDTIKIMGKDVFTQDFIDYLVGSEHG